VDVDGFWKTIAEACQSDPVQVEGWNERLQAELMKYPPDEILSWNHIFDRMDAQAFTEDLWGAAYIINGGASDDGFYYFRCWLIGMGRDAYEAAIADPDNLAHIVEPGLDAEVEIYAAAHQAWMEVTGESDTTDYPARNEASELRGEAWNFDDKAEVRRRFPRLAALYLDAD